MSGCFRFLVGREFWRVLDADEIGVREDPVFDFFILGSKERGEIAGFLLAEVDENRLAMGGRGVEGTFERFGRVVVVFHVVREHHELGEINEAAEFRVVEPGVGAAPLGEHAVAVVGLFNFDKTEREAVDE